MGAFGWRLEILLRHAGNLDAIGRDELGAGDRLIMKTQNSVYYIDVAEAGTVFVSGGWFDRKGISPMKTRIRGCTWGGSSIMINVLAACGLRLEFQNRLVTSSIRSIFVLPAGSQN
jgi:hypothetical protein